MQIEIIGHGERHLLQNIALAFFPATGFSIVDDGLFLKSTLEGDVVKSLLRCDGKEFSIEEIIHDKDDIKAAIARSFYIAAHEATGITVPWGTLSGIRPPKKVAQEQQIVGDDIKRHMYERYFVAPQKCQKALEVLENEKVALDALRTDKISLYVGIPFCPSRCSYCSFISHTIKEAGTGVESYVDTLIDEISYALTRLRDAEISVQCIYVGGGTPTSITANSLKRILSEIAKHIDVSDIEEYTVEAGRADTIDEEKLRVIYESGVRRISVNVQSTDEKTLMKIGRTHNKEDFINAFSKAREIGFENINVDLIAGLANEDFGTFERSLSEVLALDPENITVHTLCLKKAALLEYNDMKKSKAGIEELSRMVSHCSEELALHGYSPYYMYRQRNTLGNLENTGFAKQGKQCLYNVYTMGEYQSILALGAGAVSKVIRSIQPNIVRFFNHKHYHEYARDFDKAKRNIDNFIKNINDR